MGRGYNMSYIKKSEMANFIIKNLPISDISKIVPIEKDDNEYSVAEKIDFTFHYIIPRNELKPLYNELKIKSKYRNVGLIT